MQLYQTTCKTCGKEVSYGGYLPNGNCNACNDALLTTPAKQLDAMPADEIAHLQRSLAAYIDTQWERQARQLNHAIMDATNPYKNIDL